jgi:hypothetical protein
VLTAVTAPGLAAAGRHFKSLETWRFGWGVGVGWVELGWVGWIAWFERAARSHLKLLYTGGVADTLPVNPAHTLTSTPTFSTMQALVPVPRMIPISVASSS